MWRKISAVAQLMANRPLPSRQWSPPLPPAPQLPSSLPPCTGEFPALLRLAPIAHNTKRDMQAISTHQISVRALLEVLACVSPKEALQTAALVCKDWLRTSASDELWSVYAAELVPAAQATTTPLVDYVRSVLPRLRCLYMVGKTGVVRYAPCAGLLSHASVPQLQSSRYASWVTLPCGDILLCGGVELPKKEYLRSVYRLHYCASEPVAYPPMLSARAGGGLCLYGSVLYAFGGDNPLNLTSSEKLSLDCDHWTQVPDMLTPRRSFNPALHGEDVYLAGGGGSLRIIEVFHIPTEDYDVLPIALPYIDSLTCAMVVAGQLVVLIREKMLAWRIGSDEDLREVAELPNLYWFSPAGVTTFAGRSYFSPYYDGGIHCLSHSSLTIASVSQDSLEVVPYGFP